MAQYYFDASQYPVGTTLASFGFTEQFGGAIQVEEITTGVFAWRVTNHGALAADATFTDPGLTSGTDLLLIKNYVHGNEGSFSIAECNIVNGSNKYTLKYQYNGTNTTFTKTKSVGGVTVFDNVVTDTAPSAHNASQAFAARFNHTGAKVRARWWQAAVDGLVAAEPGTWQFDADDDDMLTSQAKVYFNPIAAPGGAYSVIAIGTAGDSAPTSAPPDPFVATPTSLSVSNIQSTSADLDWV